MKIIIDLEETAIGEKALVMINAKLRRIAAVAGLEKAMQNVVIKADNLRKDNEDDAELMQIVQMVLNEVLMMVETFHKPNAVKKTDC